MCIKKNVFFSLSGLEPRILTRWDMHKYAREAYNAGIRFIGGCCGFEAYHIRAIAEELAPERGFLPSASEKHGSWGAGLEMHTKPWVRARSEQKQLLILILKNTLWNMTYSLFTTSNHSCFFYVCWLLEPDVITGRTWSQPPVVPSVPPCLSLILGVLPRAMLIWCSRKRQPLKKNSNSCSTNQKPTESVCFRLSSRQLCTELLMCSSP